MLFVKCFACKTIKQISFPFLVGDDEMYLYMLQRVDLIIAALRLDTDPRLVSGRKKSSRQ